MHTCAYIRVYVRTPMFVHVCIYMHVCLGPRTLTILLSLDVEHAAADAIPSLGVGQYLDAIVGELLHATELHPLPCGGDILHLPPLCPKERHKISGGCGRLFCHPSQSLGHRARPLTSRGPTILAASSTLPSFQPGLVLISMIPTLREEQSDIVTGESECRT